MGVDWERADVGTPDLESLATAWTVAETHEPLISDTMFDDPVDPETLHVTVDEGITAAVGRFDIRWTTKQYYSYTESRRKAHDFSRGMGPTHHDTNNGR